MIAKIKLGNVDIIDYAMMDIKSRKFIEHQFALQLEEIKKHGKVIVVDAECGSVHGLDPDYEVYIATVEFEIESDATFFMLRWS